MKGKLLRPYEIDLSHIICAGEELEIVDGYCTYDGYSYTCIMPNGKQRVVNANYLEITDNAPYIDWGQRRYEIAKTILPSFIGKRWYNDRTVSYIEYTESEVASFAVKYADALIEKLKKNKQ